MRPLPVLALIAALMTPLSASAGACDDVSDVIDQAECLNAELSQVDRRLNSVWKRVMAEHPSGGDPAVHREEIRVAQRAWIRFRDADCAARAKTGIPKYWAVNELQCLVDMTVQRTDTLTRIYLF